MPDILQNLVKFLQGTPTAYNNLAVKDEHTLYFVIEEGESVGKLYLGDVLLSDATTEQGVASYLSELKDVDTAGTANNSILAYNAETQKWVATTVENIFNIATLVGATSDSAGQAGLVPAPEAGQEGYFLRGDGSWAPIEIPEVENQKAQVFETTLVVVTTDEGVIKEDHLTAIDRVANGAEYHSGDIAIVKDLIANGKYSYTAYVYDETRWVAMDGNYNASNVYFDEDFIFTKPIGTVSIPASGSITVAAAGKSLKNFFAGLFAAETNPGKTDPSVASFTISKSGVFEAGTVLSGITYAATFDSGKYTYGPNPTGSEAIGWTIADNEGNVIATSDSGTLPDITVTPNTNLHFVATADYSDGLVAKTNIGNDSTVQILAGTTKEKKSASIIGYSAYFYGVIDTSVKGDIENNLTSEFIRNNLTNGGKYTAGELNLSAHEGAKAMIIVAPQSEVGVTSAVMPSALNFDVPWEDGSPFTVTVYGADGVTATLCNAWVYEPALIDSTETYKITLG